MSQTQLPGHRTAADRVIEAAWLLGLLLVPVLFTPRRSLAFVADPKYFALHLIAIVIVVAWVIEWATRRYASGYTGASGASRSVPGWAGRRPERWAMLAGVALGLIAIISTFLSPAPRVSLWGRSFVGLGYELYSFLALLIIFTAVAARLRHLDQAARILLVTMAAGGITSLYGISQNLGWDPIGPEEAFTRNVSTFGNPIFFGAFLVMASMATLAVALDARRSGRPGLLFLATGILGAELAALWITGSRGPWLGITAGVVAFGVIGGLWLERRVLLTGLGVLGAGLIIAVPITLLPEGDAGGATRGLEDLGEIFTADSDISVGSRAPIWEGALELAASWERSPDGGGGPAALRPLFGLGPDMYYYSYPSSIDRDPTGNEIIFAHAHNFPLQILLELGFLGLAAFLALSLLVVHSALGILRTENAAGRSDGRLAIITAMVLAGLVGRSVEQLAGVAQVGDLMPFWVMMGLVLALAGISKRNEARRDITSPGRNRPRSRALNGAATPYIRVAIAGIVLVAGVGLFFMRDVRGIQASRLAAEGFALLTDGEIEAGRVKYERALDLMPDVELYTHQVDSLIQARAASASTVEQKVALFERARDVELRYEDRDPLHFGVQRRLAKVELEIGRLGVAGRLDDAVDRYTRLADSLRPFSTIQSVAAGGMIVAGELELGLTYAERAIDLETVASPNARAWLVRGAALERLGRVGEAIASFEQVVVREPDSQLGAEAHRALVTLYEKVGDSVRADEHRALAERNISAPK